MLLNAFRGRIVRDLVFSTPGLTLIFTVPRLFPGCSQVERANSSIAGGIFHASAPIFARFLPAGAFWGKITVCFQLLFRLSVTVVLCEGLWEPNNSEFNAPFPSICHV